MKFLLFTIILVFGLTLHFVAADPCTQSPDAGRCRATMTKYYFDVASKTCEEFLYGGCDGNENRFDTREQCQQTCAQHIH